VVFARFINEDAMTHAFMNLPVAVSNFLITIQVAEVESSL
jgi:hypothetical protein